ncbi:MAG: Trk potassium uptake system protein TrkH [uncultured Rubrobacteraceae bacterium]|uniref:Trk potassium uptake system protein TrkH n=1 Tax=uncultured Rubrobacteraceae bacterium TaxID=349277 RepID=A0A6J4Q7A8_9ACTN|nr:MAG: Trk potassium uptake system protein TrkH [uncultured Rubrobacteraceae bacterium]
MVAVNSGVVLALGLAMLVPLALSLLYRDGSWASFLVPAALMVPLGAVGLRASTRRRGGYVLERDVYFAVTLAWAFAALLGGLPYLLEGTFSSVVDSFFEGMSGFTTTGATVLADIEAESPSILFWRSMTQWLGGIGIVVLFVAVAPELGAGAARLLGAEVSGLTRTRLTTRIADTAKVLLVVYASLSLAQVLALLAVGMNPYDAVVHTFTTVATGGFSPKTASIAFYDSLAVEAVIIFFMVVSAVSFSLYYVIYTRRRLDALLDTELVVYLAVLSGAVLFVWGVLVFQGDYGGSWGRALRDAAFTVPSIMTTTGFVTADFDEWDTAAKFVLVALMFVGGCAGSTAGGLKVVRIVVVFRTNFQEVFKMIHPKAVTPLRMGGQVIPEEVRVAVLGLFCAWIAVFVQATFLVSLQEDLTLLSAATAVAATLNVVGPGFGQVGASESFEAVNAFGRAVLTGCMLLGRLEVFTALVLLSPAFWKR